MTTPESQAAEYAKAQEREPAIYHAQIEAFLAGFTAGAAHERARGEGLVEALERVHKLSLLGTNTISIEASRMCAQALAEYKRQRGE